MISFFDVSLGHFYILFHTTRHFSVVETQTEAAAPLAVSPRPTWAKMSSSMILFYWFTDRFCRRDEQFSAS